MKSKTLGFLIAIPAFCGLLLSLGHRWYEKMNQAALNRSQLHSEIAGLYFSYCRDHHRPPLNLEALEPYAAKFPRGFEEIRSARWIISWGTPSIYDPKRNKERVIGHENKSPDPNRFLLMGDGVITIEWYANYLWREEALTVSDEISEMYFAHLRDKGKPPVEFANLDQYAGRLPKGYGAIRNGRWVVSWNTPPTDNANENFDIIIACQQPTDGRTGFFVISADRSLRFMSQETLQQNKNVVSASHAIWRLYEESARHGKSEPSRLEDLQPISHKYPKAFKAIQAGQWRIRWGTVITGDPKVDSKQVLAFEQHVPTTTMIAGGYVIMADSSSRTMGSYEFGQARNGVVDDD